MIQTNAYKKSQNNINDTINEIEFQNDTKLLNKLTFSVQPLIIKEIVKHDFISAEETENAKVLFF